MQQYIGNIGIGKIYLQPRMSDFSKPGRKPGRGGSGYQPDPTGNLPVGMEVVSGLQPKWV
jgi:hypothetical protein